MAYAMAEIRLVSRHS